MRGKLLLPVAPLNAISAAFKHITPMPSRTGKGDIPLYKLRVLDDLLDRILSGRKSKTVNKIKNVKITARNIDSLISGVSAQLRIKSLSSEQYGMVFKPDTGLIINLVA
ncbi:MAG: hypothetical protein GXP33_08125 [Spirochaetes bacterium]|nr:hypothetical protein [Spirochaetota bacterium]